MNESSAAEYKHGSYEDKPGFCQSATLDDIRKNPEVPGYGG